MRPKLARTLEVTASELEALLGPGELGASTPATSDPDEQDEMNRRELLRSLSLAGVLLAMPMEEELRSAELAPSGGDLDERETLNAHLWQVFSLSTSKRLVYPLVRQELERLTAALERPHTTAVHIRLCTLAADLFQLAGEIFFDGNRYTDAAYCYTLAASAGKEADAFDLWACALTRHAFVSLYEDQATEAVPLLDVASRVARRGNSGLSTRYWVAAAQAEVFAKLGDIERCSRALDAVDAVQDLPGRIHTGGWLRFDGSRLAEQRGTCYVELGRADLATDALTDALTTKLTLRRRGSVLTDLAVLGIHQHDLDQVLHHGTAAVELARHTDSGYIGRRLQTLQGRLAPFMMDRRIADLSNQITALARTA